MREQCHEAVGGKGVLGKSAFEGIRVADFCWVLMGSQVGRELAEHGATVVHIESHKRLDPLRLSPPFRDFRPGADRSGLASSCNTNKYGISLDLSKPQGREVARRLVKWADIVGENMGVGVMTGLGLDYENCCRNKSDIIYFSASLMGQDGPYARYRGYGNLTAALAGFYQVVGWSDREPTVIYGAYPDLIAPWYLLVTLIAALDYRRRTGLGTSLDLSQLEAAAAFLGPSILDYSANHRVASRTGNRHPSAAPHGVFPCLGDDRWVAIAVFSDHEWNACCRVLDTPSWTEDPKFATFLNRKQNEDELERLISEWTINHVPEDIMRQMQAAGVSSGVVARAEDLFGDPQLSHRQHFRTLNHKAIGQHSYQAPAYRLSKSPCNLWKAAPCLGEDNEYVFKEILGYSDDEIADMLAEGTITSEGDLPEEGLSQCS